MLEYIFEGSPPLSAETKCMPYLHHSCAIIGDGLLAIAVNKQEITTVGTQGALDCGLHSNAGVDVGDDLAFTLGSIGACSFQLTAVSMIRDIPPKCVFGEGEIEHTDLPSAQQSLVFGR